MKPCKQGSVFGIIVLVTALLWPGVAAADDTSIYLVYSADVRAWKKELKKALAPAFLVKSYNVDLLAVADYSGRQKIMAKLFTADHVVLIGDKSVDILGREDRLDLVIFDIGSPDATADLMHQLKDRTGRPHDHEGVQ